MGLLTYVCVFVSFVAYAVEKGLIPVIDLCNSPNIYLSDEALKKGVNAWELYYDQPCGYTLKNIPGNAKVEYSSLIYLPRRTPFLKSMADKREWDLYRAIYRDFFPINDITKEYVEKEQNTLIGDVKIDRSDDEYLRGLEYLSSICLLSRCDSFIGGACAGTYGAIIMKEGKYDLQYVFDKGYYP